MHPWPSPSTFAAFAASLLALAAPGAARAVGVTCINQPCGQECCDTVSGDCSTTVAAQGTPCRPARDACDVVDTCDGVDIYCGADAKAPAGTVCRAAAGECDVAEACTGSSIACPDDVRVAAGTVCRVTRGPCDSAETCTGAAACPPDQLASAGLICRFATDACDASEHCNGYSAACPADEVFADGTACEAWSACVSGGTCEAGICSGGDAELVFTPAGAVVSAGSIATLTLVHSGTGGALTITGATLDSDAFGLVEAPAWPVTLASGESTSLAIRLVATAPGSYAATLSAAATGCAEPITAAVTAELAAASPGDPPPAAGGPPAGGAAPAGDPGGGGCGSPTGGGPEALAGFACALAGIRLLRRSARTGLGGAQRAASAPK